MKDIILFIIACFISLSLLRCREDGVYKEYQIAFYYKGEKRECVYTRFYPGKYDTSLFHVYVNDVRQYFDSIVVMDSIEVSEWTFTKNQDE